MKIVSVVGARPEFIQAAPVSRAIARRHQEVVVHTGQHYDYWMSQAFFDEMDLPAPAYYLDIGAGRPAWQVEGMLNRLADVLEKERPDLVLVRGDTHSTLAGSIAAALAGIPLAHVEAGERSYDRDMPEENNRRVADSLASLYFCASRLAVRQLANEGIGDGVHFVGDVMLDALIDNLPTARCKSDVLRRLGLTPDIYALVTLHRAGNVDDDRRLECIASALNFAEETIVFPAHPRTRLALERIRFEFGRHVKLIDPVGYFDMLVLEENARLIATDSGGVQREAYYLSVPCLTLRDRTEWKETVEAGWNRLVGSDPGLILGDWRGFELPGEHPALYGDGTAATRIAEILDG